MACAPWQRLLSDCSCMSSKGAFTAIAQERAEALPVLANPWLLE